MRDFRLNATVTASVYLTLIYGDSIVNEGYDKMKNALLVFLGIIIVSSLSMLYFRKMVHFQDSVFAEREDKEKEKDKEKKENNPPLPIGYFASFDACKDNNCQDKSIPPNGESPVQLLSLNQLSKGIYLVTATADVKYANFCSFHEDSFSKPPKTHAWMVPEEGVFSFTESLNLPQEGNISLYCKSNAGDPDGTGIMFESKASLAAIKITN